MACYQRLISLQDFQICSWLNPLNRGLDGINLTCDARPIRRDNHYCQLPALQVLLVLNALVCRKQEVIAFFLGQIQKFSVPERLPSKVLDEINSVTLKGVPQWRGSALIEQLVRSRPTAGIVRVGHIVGGR